MRGILKSLSLLAALVVVTTAAATPAKTFTSKPFAGVKANTGSVSAMVEGSKITLLV